MAAVGKWVVVGGCALALLSACAADNTIRHGNNGQTQGTAGNAGAAGDGVTAGVSGNSNVVPNGTGGAGGGSTDGGMVLQIGTSTEFKRDDTGNSGLDPATIAALKQGGASCNTTLLYPYENTIFPAGLISPLMQWQGPATASYVKVSYDHITTVSYEFATRNTAKGELRIPQDAWNQIANRSQNTALHVSLTVQSGGALSTCDHEWKVAPGIMKGTLYYNTYAAPMAKNSGQGAVMRITIGQPNAGIYLQYLGTESVMPQTGPCVSCHNVSADGSTMTASWHRYTASSWGMGQPLTGPTAKEFKVFTYPVGATAQPAQGIQLPNSEWSALYPDGSRVLTMGNPQCTGGSDSFPRAPNNYPGLPGPDHSRVIDTKTGMEIPANGLNKDWYMWLPQFSPDGTKIVFNHAKPDGKGGTDRREVAVMDYDYKSNTFSNLKVIASHLGPEPTMPYMPTTGGGGSTPPSVTLDTGANGCMKPSTQSDVAALTAGVCTGPCYPAFPFFTPDSKGVVFGQLSQPDFVSASPGRDTPAMGELWYADVTSATPQAVLMKNANTSLDPKDSQANYFPTVLPVQVGGYFWAFWTSRRSWGHHLDSNAAGISVPNAGSSVSSMQAYKKRIWVTAIKPRSGTSDVQSSALTDPSAPGFYFEGQSETGNVRAFATLSPCVAAGTTCTSGLDCCTGYCSVQAGQTQGMCTDKVPMCAKTNDKCQKNADCCKPSKPDEPQNICLGGFCGFVVPS